MEKMARRLRRPEKVAGLGLGGKLLAASRLFDCHMFLCVTAVYPSQSERMPSSGDERRPRGKANRGGISSADLWTTGIKGME